MNQQDLLYLGHLYDVIYYLYSKVLQYFNPKILVPRQGV